MKMKHVLQIKHRDKLKHKMALARL